MADTSKPQPKAQDDLSIEEILGSIRRIIAEDDEDDSTPAGNTAPEPVAAAQPVASVAGEEEPEEDDAPLELTNRIEPDGAIAVVENTTGEAANPPAAPAEEPLVFGMEDAATTGEAVMDDSQQENVDPKIALSEHAQPDTPPAAPTPEPAPVTEEKTAMATQEETLPKDNSLLSSNTAIATAAVMAKLARQAAITEEGNGNVTLEAMVKEMIRPMLREWLDANLPDLVQKMVERELERLTKRL